MDPEMPEAFPVLAKDYAGFRMLPLSICFRGTDWKVGKTRLTTISKEVRNC